MKTKYWHKGLTLIELLMVIGIIAVLASVVIVSLQGTRPRARATKALGQISSAIPAMVSCWGNSYSVATPDGNGGECICKNEATATCVDSYGKWPAAGSGDLTTYTYGTGGNWVKNSWRVSLTSPANKDNQLICCNSAMNGCVILNTDNASTPCFWTSVY